MLGYAIYVIYHVYINCNNAVNNRESNKMYKFNKQIKIGTWMLVDNAGWHKVKEIHSTRKWVNFEGLAGSFQAGHTSKFTNDMSTIR